MTILYSLVARGKTVLSEFTFTSGNFPTITRLLLAKIDCGRDGKVSYVYDQYVFHYLCDDGILYLCMCDDDQHQKRRIPFAFLDDIKQRFLDAHGDERHTAIAFAMNHETSFRRQMDCSTGPWRRCGSGRARQARRRQGRHGQEHRDGPGTGREAELLVDKTDRLSAAASPERPRVDSKGRARKKAKLYLTFILGRLRHFHPRVDRVRRFI